MVVSCDCFHLDDRLSDTIEKDGHCSRLTFRFHVKFCLQMIYRKQTHGVEKFRPVSIVSIVADKTLPGSFTAVFLYQKSSYNTVMGKSFATQKLKHKQEPDESVREKNASLSIAYLVPSAIALKRHFLRCHFCNFTQTPILLQ